MADVTLKDGKEFTFDLSKLTLADYRKIATSQWADDSCDELIASCAGVKLEYLRGLLFDDYRRVTIGLLRKAQDPLVDPN